MLQLCGKGDVEALLLSQEREEASHSLNASKGVVGQACKRVKLVLEIVLGEVCTFLRLSLHSERSLERPVSYF